MTVSYVASDVGGSGIDLSASDFGNDVLTMDGAGQSATGIAVDMAGNSASAIVNNINIDGTPPTISGSASPAPDRNGWNNTNVMSYLASCRPTATYWAHQLNTSINW